MKGKSKVFFGSEFDRDENEEYISKIINEIKACIEEGTSVIVVNLECIY